MNTGKPMSGDRKGRDLWRSLDEVANTPEFKRFVEQEFPNHAPELLNQKSRRHFLKVMGASVALAGMGTMSGCVRWPEEKIHPFTSRPDGRLPGVPVEYATSFEVDGVARGVLAKSFDGRPIKIEGNPQHPTSLGAADSLTQASVLGLYDPARSRFVTHGGEKKTWSDVTALVSEIQATQGRGVHVLCESTSSETLTALRSELSGKLPLLTAAHWHVYSPVSRDNERLGCYHAFGSAARPQYNLDRTDVIVSFDEDFLQNHPNSVQYTRDFARRRRPENGKLSRLYSVEGNFSLTGSNADARLPVRPKDVPRVLARVIQSLSALGIKGAPPAVATLAGENIGTEHDAATLNDFVENVAGDLIAARGRGAVMVGPAQPAGVHALAAWLNQALSNAGNSVEYIADPNGARIPSGDAIDNLSKSLAAGEVEYLIVLGGNPVYNAPKGTNFSDGLTKVKKASIHLSQYADETSRKCTWHLPAAHYLESWGDAYAWDGTHTVAQPLLQAMYGGKSLIEFVGMLAGKTESAHDLMKAALTAKHGQSFDWTQALHDGFVAGSAPDKGRMTVGTNWHGALTEVAGRVSTEFDVVFVPDSSVYDGRFSNNGWLQEQPDPMTKIAWDNAALISPHDATKLGIPTTNAMGDTTRPMLDVTVAGTTVPIVAFVMPGIAKGTVVLPLGYGRALTGRRVAGATSYNAYDLGGGGFDVYPLRTSADFQGNGVGGSVRKGSGTYELATTQDHHALEEGTGPGNVFTDYDLDGESKRRNRHNLRVVDEQELAADSDAVKELAPHVPHRNSLWKEFEYKGNKWGMTIDLTSCTGCGACVTACTAENNVGVTGKDEVAYGREMHWIRIDRYFQGEDRDNPQVAHQPVTCQQCENAPCEQVCPVGATMHSAEGLNDMVYNRCIGTRYCSNNCPYKVRRFNYFNNHRHASRQEEMAYNPDVTVRHRGVMEKCTFCVQRINKAKIESKNEGAKITDGAFTTACAQTCPAEAITFGDLNDPEARVTQLQTKNNRAYEMLEDINTKPRLQYLAKVRNPKS